MKAWNYITIDFEGQEYSLIVQIIVRADRGKAISRSKTQFLMVLINTKQNLPFLGSLWGIELRFSLSPVELKFFLTISSCSNKARNNFPFRRYQKRLIMVIELSGVQFGLKSYAWFQTKITRHEVQLPLYYIHFEIAQIQDLNSSIFWEEKIRVLETKVAKFATW